MYAGHVKWIKWYEFTLKTENDGYFIFFDFVEIYFALKFYVFIKNQYAYKVET